MERKNTDQLQQELMTGNDLDRVCRNGMFYRYTVCYFYRYC